MYACHLLLAVVLACRSVSVDWVNPESAAAINLLSVHDILLSW
jgi:hypothetical protein